MWWIYRITNNVNQKTYIGQHKVSEILKDDKYRGSGKVIKQAHKKYGKVNFSIEYLELALTQIEANALEQYYIAKEKSIGKAEYNIAKGGLGHTGHKGTFSANAIESAKKKNKGSYWYNDGNQEHRFRPDEEIPSGWVRGRLPMTEEQKKKLSRSITGTTWSDAHRKSMEEYYSSDTYENPMCRPENRDKIVKSWLKRKSLWTKSSGHKKC